MEFFTPDKNISGQVVISGDNGRQSLKTYQCCHCSKHWIVKPESGRLRGYCTSCKKVTCGAKRCNVCLPFEAKLDYAEALQARNQSIINKLTSRYPAIMQIGL